MSAVLGLAATIAVVAAGPAQAKVFAKEHFHDSFVSDPYDCAGTPAIDSGEVDVHSTAVLRASSPFPYFREHFAGTVVTTNTDTGGTFTNVFANNSHDHSITDNGAGTITITVNASGSSRYYDQFGNFVLKDPGSVRFAFDLDYHGTPGNPTTTPTFRTRSGSFTRPPETPTFPTATSAPTCASSPPLRARMCRRPHARRWIPLPRSETVEWAGVLEAAGQVVVSGEGPDLEVLPRGVRRDHPDRPCWSKAEPTVVGRIAKQPQQRFAECVGRTENSVHQGSTDTSPPAVRENAQRPET